MVYVDVHAHLQDSVFEKDLPIVLQEASQKRVVTIINNATSFEDFQQVLHIASQNPICKSALGLYPDVIVDYSLEKIAESLDFITKHKDEICAIGEIGLDYKWTKDEVLREKQRTYFIKQIELAQTLDKPIIVHSRNAEADVVDILVDMKQKNAILHCFCGKHSIVKKAILAGIFFSIPTKVVTDKQFQQLCELVPLSQILTETDSPYLHFEKGERNEPQTIPLTVQTIAKIKQLDPKEVAYIIYQNYKRLFS